MYADRDTFLKDYHAAQELSVIAYKGMGGDNGRVADDVAWNTYQNASKKSGEDGALGLMLFGRHKGSMKSLIRRKITESYDKRQNEINKVGQQMAQSWTVSKSQRVKMVKNLGSRNIDQRDADFASLEHRELPPSIDTSKESATVKNFGLLNNETKGSILLMGNANWSMTINDTWLLGAVHALLPFYPASNVSKSHIFSEKRILSITGRELFGLALFGYQQHSEHESLGCVFAPGDPDRAHSATLVDYQNAISQLTSINDADKVFKSAGFRISQVGI